MYVCVCVYALAPASHLSLCAQTQSAHTTYQYRGMAHALASILSSDGVRGLYRGLGSSLLGLSHVAVQFPLYEQLKSSLLHFGTPTDAHTNTDAPAHPQAHSHTYTHTPTRTHMHTRSPHTYILFLSLRRSLSRCLLTFIAHGMGLWGRAPARAAAGRPPQLAQHHCRVGRVQSVCQRLHVSTRGARQCL
jgi:hypothetical protein